MNERRESEISSLQNRWIKLARSLHRRRLRYRERAILVEGTRSIEEAVRAGVEFKALLISADYRLDSELELSLESIAASGAQLLRVVPAVFQQAADTETPQGVMAICSMPEPRTPIVASAPILLIVDGVRDPGNLGTLLRSALGAGVNGALLAADTTDPWSPKVIRAGAGSHFRLPISELDWSDPPALLQECAVLAADANAGVSYDEIDWTAASAVVIGNETKGLSAGANQRVDGKVGIPLANSLESLNAGVAGSVILFEASRQRRKGQRT